MTTNKSWILRKRPEGDLADGDLELVTKEMPELADGMVRVRNHLHVTGPYQTGYG